MSLVGDTNLNHIVIQNKITDPAEILNALHDGINSYLKQSETDNQDGMDAAIVVIDEENRTIQFAGARNPMIVVGEAGLEVVKADKMSIGGKRKMNLEDQFSSHEIEYKSENTYYIFSDGYADQFGGHKDKKFMVSKLRKLFQEVSSKNMNDQHDTLKNRFNEWKDGFSQTDDVLIIGFRLNS
jgi:serine phosphatase RsbU (regulator of sigma subunit)